MSQWLRQQSLDTEGCVLSTPGITPPEQGERFQLLTLALAVLSAGDFQARWEVVKVFPGLGEIAIDPLIALLQNSEVEEECHWFVVRILGEFQHPAVLTALVNLLQTVAGGSGRSG